MCSAMETKTSVLGRQTAGAPNILLSLGRSFDQKGKINFLREPGWLGKLSYAFIFTGLIELRNAWVQW